MPQQAVVVDLRPSAVRAGPGDAALRRRASSADSDAPAATQSSRQSVGIGGSAPSVDEEESGNAPVAETGQALRIARPTHQLYVHARQRKTRLFRRHYAVVTGAPRARASSAAAASTGSAKRDPDRGRSVRPARSRRAPPRRRRRPAPARSRWPRRARARRPSRPIPPLAPRRAGRRRRRSDRGRRPTPATHQQYAALGLRNGARPRCRNEVIS